MSSEVKPGLQPDVEQQIRQYIAGRQPYSSGPDLIDVLMYEVDVLRVQLAAANATIAAQRLALATMREALEQVLTESEWVKKRNEWSSQGQTVGMQPTADRACQEIHYIARLALAQPASDAAALAGAVLAAADALLATADAEVEDYTFYVDDETGPWAAMVLGDGSEIACGEEPAMLRTAADAYRRARAALRGDGAGEGPQI